MKNLSTIASAAYHDLIDYNVVDRNNDHVGSLHSMWSDADTGKLEFLGVKTGWLFGSNHVVPANEAQIDEANRLIQVGYEAAFIKEAPSIPADAEITDDQEAEIYRYYNTGGTVTRQTTETRTSTVGSAAAGAAAATGLAASAAPASTRETTTARTDVARGARAGETIEVALSEEQLKVGKRTVETGAVRLRKIVRTEQVQVPVELRREDVVVERIAATDMRPGDVAAADFNEKDINITLHREEAVVGKETVVTGAVRVHKTSETETQTVSDTVRKEDIEVDRSTDATTRRTTDDTKPRR